MNGNEIEIEFLTDSPTRGNKKQNVSVAGIVAQPLNYLKKNLENWVEETTPLNWNRLEMQDPTGNLRKESFLYVFKKLTS